jgi:hypothetical protein
MSNLESVSKVRWVVRSFLAGPNFREAKCAGRDDEA